MEDFIQINLDLKDIHTNSEGIVDNVQDAQKIAHELTLLCSFLLGEALPSLPFPVAGLVAHYLLKTHALVCSKCEHKEGKHTELTEDDVKRAADFVEEFFKRGHK